MVHLSAEMGNSVCQRFHMKQVTLLGIVFTTDAVDNLDHNPSTTTSKDSLQETAISLIQHPSCGGEGVIVVLLSSEALLSQGLLLPYHISTLMYHP